MKELIFVNFGRVKTGKNPQPPAFPAVCRLDLEMDT